ncbi:HAD family hydrolase [Psychrobacillus lasiicapitis]|uniref:HAD-IB family hydrolase n=1 Tax=Psychrobacillus lasiicapitis TaxID=1636719 RepID=A0A544THE2_9BACI|nr:HAD-IB family hydrolase [Psychrobacillus lasiicapitis]TQR16877.1 HAD-IB family hydrolase [Psychrobacillus lasiicapitis]GGA26438.1 hydrolase [Psychrobacillus lasiicapitis]
MRVAIFDFDGTLYAEETFKLLMNHLKEHPLYQTKYKRFYRSIVPPYIANKIRLYPDAKMKARSMQLYIEAFDGIAEKEMVTYFDELTTAVQKDFNQTVLARLEKHQAENIHILLVSGAYTQFLHQVTAGISFNQIIGTEIFYKDSKVDTKTFIDHVNGTRKTEHILQALEGQPIDWENSYAYGDSFSDLPVLELVGNPIAVKPEEKLLNVAKERGWEII